MAEKKVTRVVAHPKVYMHVGGKMQHVVKGTEVVVVATEEAGKGAKLVDPAKIKRVDTTTKDGTPESDASTAALEAAKAETQKAQDALVKTAADLDAANKEIARLKAAAKKK
jgi:hypothetical protein